ncbi:MAG: hypothetical protein WCT17_01575 [Bacilli bacterium]
MKIPQDVTILLTTLRQAGYQAVVVGGAVRDYIRGVKPIDYDLATSAPPPVVIELFKSYSVFSVGLQHGTVIVRINHHHYEITTFRKEASYQDYRHPSRVMFIDELHEDLSRRDFTINAMAYDDQLIDDFGGREDIKDGLIRAVGDPLSRFYEDPLRILRGLRFSCQFHYTIEPLTHQAMMDSFHLLSNISRERIQIEFFKIIKADLSWVLEKYYMIFQFLFPGLRPEAVTRYLEVESKLPLDLSIHLACLFLDNSECEKDILSLKTSKIQTNHLLTVIGHYQRLTSLDYQVLIDLFQELHGEDMYAICFLKDVLGELPGARDVLDDLLKKPHLLRHLAIDGHDLKELGLSSGPHLKDILCSCLVEVAKGNLTNQKNILLKYVEESLL